MATMALSWVIALVSALVAAVSAVRVVTTSGVTRLAAGGDLLMGLCMAAMALPATVAWYADYGMWWSGAFALLGLGGTAMAVRHAREGGWRHGRHWVHLIVGSAGMVIMTLAMTSTSSGPVLALGGGHSMAHMPGMKDTANATHTHEMAGMESMGGMGATHGADTHGVTHNAAEATTSAGFTSVWRFLVVALAVYFLLSVGASVWAKVRGVGVGSRTSSSRSLGRWLLAMPDTVLVFLASLTISAWERARTVQRTGHGRRRKLGAAPDAALAAHIGMGGTMSAMLLMMAV